MSLKHGGMGLSLLEVFGCVDRWCHHQWIQMEMFSSVTVFWPPVLALLLFLSLPAILLLRKLQFWQEIPLFPGSFVWVCSWRQTSWTCVCVCIFMVLSLILPFPNWKGEHIYTHPPLFNVCLFLPFSFLKKEKKLKISKFLFHLNHGSNISYFLSAKFSEIV